MIISIYRVGCRYSTTLSAQSSRARQIFRAEGIVQKVIHWIA